MDIVWFESGEYWVHVENIQSAVMRDAMVKQKLRLRRHSKGNYIIIYECIQVWNWTLSLRHLLRKA